FYGLPAPETRDQGQVDAGGDATLQEVVTLRDKFLAAMDDDFNSGLAISTLLDLLRTANRHIDTHGLSSGADREAAPVKTLRVAAGVLRGVTAVVGLFRKPPLSRGGGEAAVAMVESLRQLLIDLRKEARAKKDFATSDMIRDRLGELAIALLDQKE